MSADPERAFLRHAVATLAYRCAKTLRGAPAEFATWRAAETTRTPMKGESYARADIAIRRVGPEQAPADPKFEFD